ncbi:MAG: TonB-dependent receptor, partial [Terricaulis sp.]
VYKRQLEYGLSAETFETGGFDVVPDRLATHTGDRDGARIAALTGSARYAAGGYGADLLFQARRSEGAFDTFSGGAFFDLRADDPDLENEASQSVWRLGGDYAAGDRLAMRASGGQVRSDRAERDGGVETTSAQSTRSFVDVTTRYVSEHSTLTAGLSLERNRINTAPQFATPLHIGEDQTAVTLVGQTEYSSLVFTGAVRIDRYERFGTETTYSTGVVAGLGQLRLYASSGTAFKAPSLNERFELSPPFNLGNPNLKPERAQAWEIGADWTPGGEFKLGVSYYSTQIENLIEYDFLQSSNVNVGEAEIEGAEAFLEASPFDWISARLAYDWTDARNGSTGQQLLRRPEHAWRAEMEFAPSSRWGLGLAFNRVGARRDVTYADAGAFLSAAERIPGFDLITLWTHYDLGGAEFFARAENVLDEHYEQPAAFAGAPRNFQLGVRARF